MDTKPLCRAAAADVIDLGALPDVPNLNSLFSEAETVLRYNAARRNFSSAKATYDLRKQAIKVLERHDIRPFEPKSAAKYLRRTRRKANLRRTLSVYGGVCFGICCGAALCLAPFLGVFIGEVWGAALGSFGAVGVIVGCIYAWLCYDLPVFKWQLHSLTGYQRPVPAFVMQDAIYIKKAGPELSLGILELQITASAPVRDPLLVLRLPTEENDFESIYLHVWNEPRFDAPRLEVADVIDARA